MKTSTLLITAGAVGVIAMLAKTKKGLGDDDMLVPPSGRTITASGQVLGGLGLETTYQDVYDAAPSQYNLTPRNDFVPGLGYTPPPPRPLAVYEGSQGTGQYAPGARVTQGDVVFYVAREPGGSGGRNSTILLWRTDQTATAALRAKQDAARRLEAQTLAQKSVNETLAAIQKQADEQMAAQAKAEQERQAAAILAQQKAERERQAAVSQQTSGQPSSPKDPSTYNQAKQAYDAMAAAREQASMSSAASDTGYGRTSDDSGYGSTQQVTDEGTSKLPERIASVQTPSAVNLPEAAPPAAASGNTKVGLLVGGGVLAAIAAAMAS